MTPLNIDQVTQYVEENIGGFHTSRIAALRNLSLTKVLKRKNPYLFKAKNILTSQDIVKIITDAYISSQEETIFGNWLEGLAIFVNECVYAGWKSGINGIDLEFNNDGKRYIVAIKSGPSWGNSSQIRKMKNDFDAAKRTLRTSGADLNVVAVNGCCYGKEAQPDKTTYFKYCGQRFWTFISGDDQLYKKIVEPLGHLAREQNDTFQEAYSNSINLFTASFTESFCNAEGAINWNAIVELNSKA